MGLRKDPVCTEGILISCRTQVACQRGGSGHFRSEQTGPEWMG